MRGEIWRVNLDPVIGSEASKTRPAVVVGRPGTAHRAMAAGRGVIPVVPVTTAMSRVYAFQLLLPAGRTGLREDSKAQAEQLRSVDVGRLVERVGSVPADLLVDLDARIKIWLDLP
ncbi:type II toxin-antitoxin system PemK/MazF family toxin [Actinotalea sp. BY-33]|uniref:mRNA interferase n=1 Tax=Actinotalea soli TaxID=2819234 RepID=A0A939LQN5_9CELL|nr:type II toxin-antitoxin system PemK/MazF family toxin [Actinotalea soli]MBO1751235.1 type II toxin-antitoxin system PemK/MazF family toxin [Actinotalea soli]